MTNPKVAGPSATPSPSPTKVPGRGGGGGEVRPFRRKRRGWMFYVGGIANRAITGDDLLASVCERYTTVKSLVVKPGIIAPASDAAPASPIAPKKTGMDMDMDPDLQAASCVLVEIQFAGPQPSERCGALLCHLFGGDSVDARPMELPRGRKKTITRSKDDATLVTSSYSACAVLSDSENTSATLKNPGAGGPSMLLPRGVSGEDTPPPRVLPQQPGHLDFGHPHPHQQEQQQQQFGTYNALLSSPPLHAVQPPLGPAPFASVHAGGNGGEGRVLLPMEEVRVEPSRNECDLEGRPICKADTMSGIPAGSPDSRQCHLVFTGLEHTGHALDSLRATALFGVDAVHQIATVTSPIEIGHDGRAYALVFYPSMQEIWPELYNTPAIRMVEVDVAVEILSDSGGEYQYIGPQLKVTYLRTGPQAVAVEAAPESSGRRIASRMPIPYAESEEIISQMSNHTDYFSCGDGFSGVGQPGSSDMRAAAGIGRWNVKAL